MDLLGNNYIWSFWTKPLEENNKDYFNFYILCLILSIELAQKFSKKSTVYTDDLGKKIISKYIKNCEINILLNDLKNVSTKKWALPKMYCINKISEMSIHIDHDVFLRKEMVLNDNCSILCQHFEDGILPHYNFYKKSYLDYISESEYIPESILNLYNQNNNLGGYNCGFLKINDLQFAKQWTSESMKMFNYMNKFDNYNNILPEQCLLYALSRQDNIKIDCLFSEKLFETSECYDAGYIHLMGSKFRRGYRKTLVGKILKKLQEISVDTYDNIAPKIKNNTVINLL